MTFNEENSDLYKLAKTKFPAAVSKMMKGK